MTPEPNVDRRAVLLTALFSVFILLIMGGMALGVISSDELKSTYEFSATSLRVADNYGGALDYDAVISTARQAMFRNLDRYSRYLSAEEFGRLREELSGGYSGIGVMVIRHNLGLMVMGVSQGGPAARAGLLLGDIIIATDSVVLAGLNGDTAVSILRGEEGESVQVEVFRPATADTFEVEIERGTVPLLHIPYAGITPDSLIYIRLVDFEAGASGDLEAALDSLLQKEGSSPRGIILDLRGNPGGLFSEGYRTANLFLDGGQFIVGTDSRSRWNEEKHFSTGRDMTGGLPMAVLVDGFAASAAEIAAGSLGQLGRAVLVGDTTFGKGLVQGYSRFVDGSGLRLTISRYYLEGGVYLNQFDSTLQEIGSGLPPDFYMNFPDQAEFPIRLENSLLLHRFAAEYQNEIIEQSSSSPLADSWLNRFADYAAQDGFIYTSSETELAEFIAALTSAGRRHFRLRDAAEELVTLAHTDDIGQMELHKDYIKRRLKQLAFERKHGIYRSYAAVVADGLPELARVSEILIEQDQ